VTLTERKSRFTLLRRAASKKANLVSQWSYPVSVDTWRLGVMGYEAEQLRTGLVKDSPGPNVVDADCTSLR
jgi:hypothetical protein